MAVSDILTKIDLPDFIREDLTLYVGCIAGAAKPGEYEGWMREAGFKGECFACLGGLKEGRSVGEGMGD